jgi:hypothetical protein
MRLPLIITALAMAVTAAPSSLGARDGTNWSLKAYSVDMGVCKNAFRWFEGSSTRGCTTLSIPASAVSVDTDVDCVINIYAEQDCPRGTGKALGPRSAGCVADTVVQSFRVDCGVV